MIAQRLVEQRAFGHSDVCMIYSFALAHGEAA